MADQLTIILPKGADLDAVEDCFLDDFDDILGDVEECGVVDGRDALILQIRDGKSAVIGARRLLKGMGLVDGVVLRHSDGDFAVDGDDLPSG